MSIISIRFKDTEIEKKTTQVVGTVIKAIMQKELMVKKFVNDGSKMDQPKDNQQKSEQGK